MMYVLTAFNISIFILGIHVLTESVLLNLFKLDFDKVYEKLGKISMPLIVCPTCMSSLWGVPLAYLVSCQWYEVFILVPQIALFNYVFSKVF